VALLIEDLDDDQQGHGAGLGLGLVARVGDADRVRRTMAEHPLRPGLETWATPMLACFENEAASVVGDPKVARRWAKVLEPLAGRMAIAGVSMVFGPVDGYLALAAATTGEVDAARRYADHALVQAEAWQFPVYREWLVAHRHRLGF
jgi:hypothetical protein